MSPSVYHRCQHCEYESDAMNVLGPFHDNPHCPQCGLSMSESENDMKMQDDLARLMAQSLHLGKPMDSQQHNQSMPTTPQVMPQQPQMTYISQHYHHSSHQASATSVSTTLAEAGVDPTALFPSQLQLFKHAPHDQQLRLIELWRIAPPTPGNQLAPKDLGNWPQTSLQQEEEAAAYRWDKMGQTHFKTLNGLQDAKPHAEPYIISGYDSLPNINGVTAPTEYGANQARQQTYTPSIDPVYQSREWWRMTDEEPMEHQYGILQHMQMYGQQLDQSGEGRDHEMS